MNVLESAILNAGLTETGGSFFTGSAFNNTSSVVVGSGQTLAITGVPTNGLAALWHLDGNTQDVFGANNATNSNALTYVNSPVGRGADIGTGGFIDIANNGSLQFQQLSVGTWVRVDGPGTNTSVELGWASSSNRFYFAMQGTYVSSIPFPAGSGFHHVAATYDGATLKLYVDGVFQSQAARTGTDQLRLGIRLEHRGESAAVPRHNLQPHAGRRARRSRDSQPRVDGGGSTRRQSDRQLHADRRFHDDRRSKQRQPPAHGARTASTVKFFAASR